MLFKYNYKGYCCYFYVVLRADTPGVGTLSVLEVGREVHCQSLMLERAENDRERVDG